MLALFSMRVSMRTTSSVLTSQKPPRARARPRGGEESVNWAPGMGPIPSRICRFSLQERVLLMSSRVLACPSVCMCLFFALFYLQKWKDMVGHGRTWEDMIECVLPCLPLSSISDHVFPCPTMSYHVPPCPTMSHHVLPFLEVKKGENRHMHTLGHAWT